MGYKFLFLIGSAPGHLNATIELVKELVKQGNEVTYYTVTPVQEILEKSGAILKVIQHPYFYALQDPKHLEQLGKILHSSNPNDFPLFFMPLMILQNVAAQQILQEQGHKTFDMIFSDAVYTWPYQASRLLKTKRRSTFHVSFVLDQNTFPVKVNSLYTLYQYLNMQFTIYTTLLYQKIFYNYALLDVWANMNHREDFNLINSPKEFQPLQKHLNDKRLRFRGPYIRDRDSNQQLKSFPFDKLTKPKVIYCSLGSMSFSVKLYELFVDAFNHPQFKDYNVVMNVFDMKQLKKKIPDNFITQHDIPQIAILKRSDLYICHGGINSVTESALYKVPQIIIPQMQERELNAKTVQRMGIGDYLNQSCSAEELRNLSIKILKDPQIPNNLQKISESLQQQSPDLLVQEIYECIENGV